MSGVDGTVVDTDVFSVLFIRASKSDSRAVQWRHALGGRRVLIAFHTRAELLAGAQSRRWGAQRIAQLMELLNRTPTIYSDTEVVDAYARLTAECRAVGHGLHDKPHTGDRWIAACAIAKRFTLLTGDAIFQGLPNVDVLN